MIIPQRFPHPDGADLGDNYVSGISDHSNEERSFEDKFVKNDPLANKNHGPSILKPFMGFYDQNLKGVDWTPLEQEQHRNSLIHALDNGRLDLGRAATDYFRPTRAYLKQWHPRAHNRHMARQDRFKPLSNYPKHEATKDRPAVMGLPTKAENTLLFGSCDTNKNPCDMQALLGDTEKPAEDVLLDAKGNNFIHKPQGEPISDSVLANWDLWNGVADP